VQGGTAEGGVTYINVINQVTSELNLPNEKKTKVYFHRPEIGGCRCEGPGSMTRKPNLGNARGSLED
jgi:hypothetical protein